MKNFKIACLVSMAILTFNSCKKDDNNPPGPSANYGLTSTFAGSGADGNTDGNGATASFKNPVGIASDAAGNIYVADDFNYNIRKITPAGVVTTLAGSGVAGSADGTGTAASFNRPWGLAVDAAGNVFVSELYGHKIRKITPAGVVTTLAGSGVQGSADGTGAAATFNYPSGLVIDASGNLFVCTELTNNIRKITPAGVVTTFAGSGAQGAADGTGTAATFYFPVGLGIDASGNLYVGEEGNDKIRKVTPAGVVTTLAGSGTEGSADGTGAAASFRNPWGVTVDASGVVYVGDSFNSKIRKVTQAGVVTTFAGSATPGNLEGVGILASFSTPVGLVFNPSGDLFVADYYNRKIRKIIAH